MKFRLALVICAVLATLTPKGAGASQTLHGIVLTVLSGKQQAIVRHEAYGGMPAMAMLFKISSRDAARLREGDRIDATVSEGAGGESLTRVRVLPAPVAARGPELRSIAAARFCSSASAAFSTPHTTKT